jgi:hypothetical protein
MNKRQFNNMMKRRKTKQAEQAERRATDPVMRGVRVWRQPTAVEMGQVEGLIQAEKERERIQRDIRAMFEKIRRLGGWHLHWRASRLLDKVDTHGKRPNHPKYTEGKKRGQPIPMRKCLGLPADPKRKVIDDAVPVVTIRVRSLPQKGNVPILKPVGVREVDFAPEFYMHSKLFDTVEPIELLKWLTRFHAVIENGTLRFHIIRMEAIYGTPRVRQDFSTIPETPRLESKVATKEASQQIKRGPFVPRGTAARTRQERLERRAKRDRERIAKGFRPFRQPASIVNRAFAIEVATGG